MNVKNLNNKIDLDLNIFLLRNILDIDNTIQFKKFENFQ